MLCNRLKELRKEKGLRQKELAHHLGLSPARYNQYEKGKRQPDNITLINIAVALGTTADYLLGADQAENLLPEKPWEELEEVQKLHNKLIELNNGHPLTQRQTESLLSFLVSNEEYVRYIIQKNK